jgi:hypothetical protein
MSQEAPAQTCANCGQPLDPADKFCRECGLPTMRHASDRKRVPAAPPDTGEMRRALNVQADPPPSASAPTPPPQTTGDVIKATSPTQAVQMASSTLLMIGLIVLLALAGIALLVLALQP